jgi:hypothetical protein
MKQTVKCDKSLTFQECELAILRSAVDLAETKMGKRLVNTPEVQEMIQIVEDFLKKKNLICYGGVAIDALLPEQDKIYDKDVEVSDYDFYSPNALEDAKELADIYAKKGYTEVEAKAGAHKGTFKVFCNFMGVADITYIPPELFNALKREAVRVKGILYCPANFLKMAMYLELSRPAGQIDRFEKVFKRLNLLNKYYPLKTVDCHDIDYQREMNDISHEDDIYKVVRDTFVNQGVVFFGGYAINLYSRYMPKGLQQKVENIPDFDVLSNDPETTCEIIEERLGDIGIKNIKIIKHEPVGEIIPEHHEIIVGKDSIAFVYKPIACHSYNVINISGQKVKVATIDTMLNFYLAFLYADREYYSEFAERTLCMAKFLFDVQQKNRLEQKGLLRRFSITCYGHQESVSEMREHRNKVFSELKSKKGTKEYDEWFLNYKPAVKKGDVVPTEKKAPTKVPTKGPAKSKNKKRNATKKRKSFLGIYYSTNNATKRKKRKY